MNKKNEIAIVLGMHRSGTSVLAKLLIDLGYDPGENLMPASEENPLGYFEDLIIHDLNNRILDFLFLRWDQIEDVSNRRIDLAVDLVWENFGQESTGIIEQKLGKSGKIMIKDPRLTILLKFWLKVLDQFKAQKHYFLAVRNPLEVSASLNKRNNMSEKNALQLWYYYNYSCLTDLDERLCIVRFGKLISDPENEVNRILNHIHVKHRNTENLLNNFVNSFVDKKQIHHHSTARELINKTANIPEIESLYDFLIKNDMPDIHKNEDHLNAYNNRFLKPKTDDNDTINLTSTLFCENSNIDDHQVYSTSLRHKTGYQKLSFKTSTNNLYDKFRLFLCDHPCVITLESLNIHTFEDEQEILNLTGNFFFRQNNLYLFNTNTPFLKFALVQPHKILHLDIEFSVNVQSDEIAGLLIPVQFHKIKQAGKTIEEQVQKIQSLTEKEISTGHQNDILLKEGTRLQTEIEDLKNELDMVSGTVTKLEEQNNILTGEKSKLLKDVKVFNLNANRQTKEIDKINNKLLLIAEEKEYHIRKTKSLLKEIAVIADKNKKVSDELTRLNDENKSITDQLRENKVKADELEELTKKAEYLWYLKQQNDAELNQLKEEIAALKNSWSWRFTFPVRLAGRYMVFVLKPAAFIYKDVKYGIELLKREGFKSFINRIFWYARGKRLPEDIFLAKNREEFKSLTPQKINTTDKIEFPDTVEPLVSIIIPVFNQWEYTYKCLKSIVENTGDIPYEIIIADDASTDETRNITNYIKNIRIIRNEDTLHFLGNCNKASKQAKGKYLHLLNNDVVVHPEWLSSLIKIAEKDNKVGIVGSKLIYPDGKLQEAGGIIWNDASGWNYGKFDDPEKSEYNYLKEVDYISGASLCIRKNLWDQLGGFDEHFTPAYYEDTDLAFRVREKGYKVIYQPLSIVTHLEGVSHGKSESEGIKKYQVDNQIKFRNRYQDILADEHSKNGTNVFSSRERSKDKKQILVIDHYVPHYDKDAGSRSTFSYLRLLVEMGYNVKFIGDNFYRHEPYTTVIQQLGIEVLYGNYYQSNIQKWIKDNGDYFDFVITHRLHIAPKYFQILKQNTNAKIIYIGHDLQFLSSRRKYEVTGDENHKNESIKFKELESYIFNTVDIILPFSTYEAPFIKEIAGDKVVETIPVYFYDNIPETNSNFHHRKDILFVGGFGHPPNIDAIKWFVTKIFPLVRSKIPEAKLYVVGSNPTDEVKGLASESIIITGFVSDEQLIEFYNHCKVAVLPLRFGAGVKGKLLESLHYQIPAVITSVAAEGVPEIENYSLITNQPEEFAEKIQLLYSEEKIWHKYSSKGKELIQKYYCTEATKEILEKILT